MGDEEVNSIGEDRFGYRWAMLTVISASMFMVMFTGFSVPPALPQIGLDFQESYAGLGSLMAAFLLGHAFAFIPSAILAERWSQKGSLLLGITLTAGFSVVSAVSPNFILLLLSRFIVGVGVAATYICSYSLIGGWFRRKELGLALGISIGVAWSLGQGIVSFGIVPTIIAEGWRLTFLWIGIAGLVIAFLGLVLVRNPPEEAGEANEVGHGIVGIKRVIRNRSILFLGLGDLGIWGAYLTVSHFTLDYAFSVISIPQFYAGILASLLAFAGIPAGIVGGVLVDKFGRTRMLLVAPALLAAVMILLTGFGGGVLLWLGVFFMGFITYMIYIVWLSIPLGYSDITHRYAGSAVGLMETIAYAGGSLAPLTFGYIVDATGGFSWAWVYLAVTTATLSTLWLGVQPPKKMTPHTI